MILTANLESEVPMLRMNEGKLLPIDEQPLPDILECDAVTVTIPKSLFPDHEELCHQAQIDWKKLLCDKLNLEFKTEEFFVIEAERVPTVSIDFGRSQNFMRFGITNWTAFIGRTDKRICRIIAQFRIALLEQLSFIQVSENVYG